MAVATLSRFLLGDGAMGTELIARGASASACLPELNVSRPDLVASVHRDYAAAGAEVHRTNTFTANRLRLAAWGLGGRARELNAAGAKLAREAAGKGGRVAGSVGPLEDVEASPEDKRRAWSEQCAALVEAGCSTLVLETFRSADELALAVGAATGFDVAVAALLVPDAGDPLAAARRAADAGAGWVGVNCVPPATALPALRAMRALDGRCLLAAFPSAGRPGAILPPEAFAAEAAGLRQAGVRWIGGCCGAGPAHIRALALRS